MLKFKCDTCFHGCVCTLYPDPDGECRHYVRKASVTITGAKPELTDGQREVIDKLSK